MENWKVTRDWLFDMENHHVKIASHRGVFSSSVIENTSLAFLLAVEQGADMVEMDLEITCDGILVGHHDNTMERLFHKPGRISDYTWEELSQMPIYNYVGEICVERLETFEEILKNLKGKTILVLDKCWHMWDQVYEMIKKADMIDQVILKFYVEDDLSWSWISKHSDCMVIPMLGDISYLPKVADLKSKIKIPALEILPEKETDEVFKTETFQWLESNDIKVWCNSLSLAKNITYGAGFDDLKSLRQGGDFGWGELIRRGVTIIQTDWVHELKQYINLKEEL